MTYEIELIPNEKEKTFKLVLTYTDGSNVIYKSVEQSQEEFEYILLQYTQNDLKNFVFDKNQCYKIS